MAKSIIYQNVWSKTITPFSTVKNLDQPIDPDIQGCQKLKKLTAWQDGNCFKGFLLNFEYIKNHKRLIAVDLSRQKELHADPKVIQKIEFVGQVKKTRWQW